MKVLGLDIGFGHTKVVSDGVKMKFPTMIAYAPNDPYAELDVVNIAGMSYVVGRDARFSQFGIEIPTVAELVKYAPVFLRYVTGILGEFDVVVTGLPPNCKAYVPVLKQNLESVASGTQFEILPQGVGILYDVMDKISDEVIIVDIGYNTVDCVVAKEYQGVWKKSQVVTFEGFGVMKCVELMRDILPQSLEFFRNRSASRLLDAFERGYVMLDGEKVALDSFKAEAQRKYGEILMAKIKQELKGDYRAMAQVVIAGGGAYYIDPKQFGSGVYVPQEPEFSQARGYYKCGKEE